MSARADLVELLSAKTTILLDFDGPVCSIFANHPAPGVAAKLIATLADAGVAIASELEDERDPLEVLKWTATLGRQQLVREVESVLCAEEAEAAQTSARRPSAGSSSPERTRRVSRSPWSATTLRTPSGST